MPVAPTTEQTVTRRAAYELRQIGWTFPAIAAHLGFANANAAMYAVEAHARATGASVPSRSARRSAAARQGAARRHGRTVSPLLARRFGIEIEFSGLDPYRAAEAIRAAGLEAEAEGYNHDTRDHWKIVSDSTCGYEAVSPILSGEDGYEQVRKVMRALSEAGARVDRRCGMHVHRDVNDLTGEAIATLVETYAGSQTTIDRFLARSRRSGQSEWCAPMTARDVERVAEGFRTHRQADSGVTRYRSINVQSFPRYGTVEIRQHQGTLNGSKAVAWIMLGQALVVAAQTETPVDGGSVETFLASLVDAGLPTEQSRRLARRAEALA